MTRVANYGMQQTTLANLQRVQSQMAADQIAISSSKTAQRYDGIAPQAQRVVNLEQARARASTFVDGNKLVDGRLETMETSTAGVLDVASKIRTTLISAINAQNIGSADMNSAAKSALSQVASLLNVQSDGRYLFAGGRTDTAPVDLSTLPADGNFGTATADTFYYRGDATKLSARVDETTTVAYGETASNPAFEKLIRGLQMAATADTTDQSKAQLTAESALDLVNQALSAIPDLRSRIGNARSTLEAVNTQHTNFMTTADRDIGDIQNTDVTAVYTRLSAEQTALNASYSTIAKFQNTSLLDYLR